ncbi:MAG: type II secretion system secretin GspD [Verrucomicrobiota bacterium]|nr:type II secretion system secretin GspD [Verrucomicrobiota bacterium]
MKTTRATGIGVGPGAAGTGILIMLAGFLLAQEPPAPMPLPRQPASPVRPAQTTPERAVPPPAKPAEEPARDRDFNYVNTPLDGVLQDYAKATGRTPLIHPQTPKIGVTLKSQGKLTLDEWIEALDAMFAMNGISVLKQGAKFLKVIPSAQALQEASVIRDQADLAQLKEKSELVTQLVTFKHVDLAEVEKVVKPVLHSFGKLDRLERINGVLITDTAVNVTRAMQIIGYIDQPVQAREEPKVVQIRYAKASAIKQKLEEIIAQSKEEQKKIAIAAPRRTGAPGMEQQTIPPPPSPIPGVIRPPAPASAPTTPAAAEEALDLAERGIIHGKVQITADDRTNKLIIITTPENMSFLLNIIQVLDVETMPDVLVKVIRLEHADAETVAASLNTLIGGKPKEAAPTPPAAREGQSYQDQAAALRDYVTKLQQERAKAAVPAPGAGEAMKSKIGELSADSVKLLPDKRSNSIVVMASISDFNQIRELVKCLDIMLAQVLVEAIILEVQLGDSVQTGVDWVQRAMVAYEKNPNGVSRSALFAFAGGGGGGSATPQNPLTTTVSAGGGLTYYLTCFGLNLDAVVNMASSDSGTRVLASPVIVTHDNVEATINAGEQRYFYKGQRWVQDTSTGGHYEPAVESKNVGIILTVKPHINEKGLVVMDIKQTIDELAEGQKIGDTLWPTTLHREMNASVSVGNRETIVLGGLVKQSRSKVSSGIPLLHKIPILGALFGYDKTGNTRNEVIVFLTPYVMNSPEQVAAEARRRKLNMDTAGMWRRGWSDSPLAEGQPAAPEAPKTAGARPAEAPKPAAAEKPAAKPPSTAAPNIDPELLRFIARQEKRYGKAMEEADRAIEREMNELPTTAP